MRSEEINNKAKELCRIYYENEEVQAFREFRQIGWIDGATWMQEEKDKEIAELKEKALKNIEVYKSEIDRLNSQLSVLKIRLGL